MTSANYVSTCSYLFLFLFHFIKISKAQFYSDLPPLISTSRGEKLTHLHFFFQDIVSGKGPTSVQIAGPRNHYSPGFGTTMMSDDRLTVGADQRSEVIGRAQGLYGVASKEEVALLMVMNYVFTKGRYKGSSIAILGRNPPMQDVREMPIVGGTGLFRFARGYGLAHTVWSNPQGDATVEYHVYVHHF